MLIKLKPCPFCGSTEVKMYSDENPDYHGFVHICEGFDDYMIKVESRFFSTEDEAIEAWNRRVRND